MVYSVSMRSKGHLSVAAPPGFRCEPKWPGSRFDGLYEVTRVRLPLGEHRYLRTDRGGHVSVKFCRPGVGSSYRPYDLKPRSLCFYGVCDTLDVVIATRMPSTKGPDSPRHQW